MQDNRRQEIGRPLSDTVDASLEERAGLGSGRLWIKRTGRQLYRAFHLPSGVALASSPSATAPIGPASVPSDGCLIMSSSAEAFRSGRSEARRVGKECVSTCSSGGWRYN